MKSVSNALTTLIKATMISDHCFAFSTHRFKSGLVFGLIEAMVLDCDWIFHICGYRYGPVSFFKLTLKSFYTDQQFCVENEF
jgi:hypothetical protein